ncbi:MAG: Bax inhibitor-1/YccA family protein [Candidatus Omnitrophota bacterium]
MRSGNPALRGDIFKDTAASGGAGAMTIQGTVNKTLLLLMLTVISATWVWGNPAGLMPLMVPAAILGFITALVTIFKKEWAGITAPAYALLEGVFLGGISALFEAAYPGIVIQAVLLTFGTLFCLLVAYKSGLIKVTENFKLGVVAATGAIALIYIVSIIVGFFGVQMPLIHSSGPVGIIFSLIVVCIAALNLVLDFDFIEKGEEAGAPKYMEWYGAFGLMVTLIWLYLEMLRLLSKLRSR